MTGLKFTLISQVGNWLLLLGRGYKTDWCKLKSQCSHNNGSLGIRLCENNVELILVILGQKESSDCWLIFSGNSVLCLELTLQYIPRNMHTVFALLCFVVVIHWLIFPYPSGLLHWHCGNLTIAPVPAKQPWWIWINTSCAFIMNDCITTTKQSTTNPCAYLLGYTVCIAMTVF